MKNLTAYNECNNREIGSMVGKAMCAYANARQIRRLLKEDRGIGNQVEFEKAMSEYEATVRCLGLFVKEPIPDICRYVIGRCEDEFGI